MNEPKPKMVTENKPKNIDGDVPLAPSAADAGASVEKIRDILFGSQIKNYDSRFGHLEETLVRETNDLKDTMKRRFESLEDFFKNETAALAARLKAEREERATTLSNMDRDVKASHEALAKKIIDLDGSTGAAHSGLRGELMAESRKLLDEIRQRHDSLNALLERRVDELRNQKTDRHLLAGLLTEIAAQLADEGEPSDKVKPAKAG